jgi:hypothetical protein
MGRQTTTERKCLRCDKKFKSKGVGNRICDVCNRFSWAYDRPMAKEYQFSSFFGGRSRRSSNTSD